MKKTKFFAALVAMLALGVVACNNANSEPAKESSAPAKASSQAPTTSKAPAVDYTQILPRTWTEGTPVKNSSDKNYIPLTDATNNKVGVKIAVLDFTLDAPETTATGMDNSGKIEPGNDHGAYIRFRIVAPKAGDYQMIMRGKSSTSNNALEKSLNDRAFDVKLNGESVDVQGDRVVLTAEQADFVAVPTIHLTGQEDTIDVTASDYRIQFDREGFVVFSEH